VIEVVDVPPLSNDIHSLTRALLKANFGLLFGSEVKIAMN